MWFACSYIVIDAGRHRFLLLSAKFVLNVNEFSAAYKFSGPNGKLRYHALHADSNGNFAVYRVLQCFRAVSAIVLIKVRIQYCSGSPVRNEASYKSKACNVFACLPRPIF